VRHYSGWHGDELNMIKLPQHPLWKIRPHVHPTLDEAKEKGLLGGKA